MTAIAHPIDDSEERSIGAAIVDAARRLADAGVDQPQTDARVLLAHVLKISRASLLGRNRAMLPAEAASRFARLIERRAGREPVAHLTGRREFWSLEFRVGPDVLTPRPDSETVVEAVLDDIVERSRPWRILDLGTGSGCLLLALLSELPAAYGVGVDISAAALTVASGNAKSLGLAGRADFVQGDWGAGLAGGFNIIVTNPPYIADSELAALAPEIVRHEPRQALAAGTDGLAAYRNILPHAAHLLRPDGLLVAEVGAGQAGAAGEIAREAGFCDIRTRRDLAEIDRCILATLAR